MAILTDRISGVERRVGNLQSGIVVLKRISWGAVFGGLIITLVVQLMLSLLGVGIGMGTVDPLKESNPFVGLGMPALIWGVFSMLISFFVGGLVAARLAGIPKTIDSVLHGLLTFSLSTIVMFLFITTAAGAIVGGVGGIAMQTLSIAGKGVGDVVGKTTEKVVDSVDLGNIKREASALFTQTEKNPIWNQNIEGSESDSLVDDLFGNADKEIDREAVVNAISDSTGKSREETERIADKWIQNYQNAKKEFNKLKVKAEQQARETGAAAASAISKAGIFLFIGLLFGAAAAVGGGKLGEPHDIATRTVAESSVCS
ncbi:MAG: hypothetical protein NUV76_04710 [Candidatus Kuenenia sp.]|nr:hypothetical protein [Candidatus Kuenenia sp.]